MKNNDNQNENLKAEDMSQSGLSTDSINSISSNNEINITQIFYIASHKIEEGLANPTASTGTAIAELSGMAKTLAQLANIGGGSKATGGGGVEDGIKTLTDFSRAQGYIERAEGEDCGDGAAGVASIANNQKPLTGPTGNRGLTGGAEVSI